MGENDYLGIIISHQSIIMKHFNCIVLFIISCTLQAQEVCSNLQFTNDESAAIIPSEIGNIIGNGPFTIELWINGTSEDLQGQHPTLFSNRNAQDQSGVSLLLHDNWGGSSNKLICFNFEDQNYFSTDCPLILDANCHHIAVSRFENTLNYYLDGDFIFSRNIPAHFSFESEHDILLGGDRKNSFATPFLGAFDELKFWNRTLSASEISSASYRDLVDDPNGLVAHYRFIDDSNTGLLDESGNGYHGHLGDDDGENEAEMLMNCCAPINISSNVDTPFDVQIFPNPVAEQLKVIVHSGHQETSYQILNAVGIQVAEGRKQSVSFTINLQEFSSGNYVLILGEGDRKIVKSFIICQD